MTRFKLSSLVALSFMLAVSLFAPTTVGALPVATNAETVASPAVPGVASFHPSGAEISTVVTTSGCLGSSSGTEDGGRPSTYDGRRAVAGSLSSTGQPIPDECPDDDDDLFWDDVLDQIAEECDFEPDIIVIWEIECEEVGDDVYTWRAEATCIRFL